MPWDALPAELHLKIFEAVEVGLDVLASYLDLEDNVPGIVRRMRTLGSSRKVSKAFDVRGSSALFFVGRRGTDPFDSSLQAGCDLWLSPISS